MAKHDTYVVNRDGSGQLRPQQVTDTVVQDDSAKPAPEGDLSVVVNTLVSMAQDLKQTFDNIPDLTHPASHRVRDELFNAATRQAYITAGNAIDHAFRLTDEIRRSERVKKLKRELAEEMSFLGWEGDPDH